MKKLISLLLLTVLTITLTGCNQTEQYDIYVTVYPMQYLAETIGGDTITVGRVPGSQVHSDSYDWSQKETIAMQSAAYIFYVGANSDNYIPDNEALFNEGSVELVHIANYIEYSQVCYESDHTHTDEDHETTTQNTSYDEMAEDCDSTQLVDDPHFWINPNNMFDAALLVKNKLIEAYPENEELYNQNYDALLLELQDLSDDYDAMALNVTKPIITTNMLFNYWHEAYDIEILSLVADAHVSNTVPDDIIHFVEEAVFHDIHFILFEKNSNSPTGDAVLAELLLEDSRAEARYLHGLGILSTTEEESGEDYISLMRYNLEILEEVTQEDTE